MPGRKTDVKDCVWIAQLLEPGLIRASFVPPAPIRELRDLTERSACEWLIARSAKVVGYDYPPDLKLEGADGCPVRAIALVDRGSW